MTPDDAVDRPGATDATLLASRALLGMVARSLAPALDEVTVPQFRVLVVVSATGSPRMGDLAEIVGVHPSTLTRTVERLEQGGWLARAQIPGDRRGVHVDLTDAGRALVERVTAARRGRIAEVIAGLEDGERAAVERGMAIFARAAGEPDPRDLREIGI